VAVINKSFGELRADLALDHFKAKGPANVYQYSGEDLARIRALPAVLVSRPGKKAGASAVKEQLFPAMSITMYAIPGR
jgi:hypothetical protein